MSLDVAARTEGLPPHVDAMMEEAVWAAVAVMSDEEVTRRVEEARAATD